MHSPMKMITAMPPITQGQGVEEVASENRAVMDSEEFGVKLMSFCELLITPLHSSNL